MLANRGRPYAWVRKSVSIRELEYGVRDQRYFLGECKPEIMGMIGRIKATGTCRWN